MGFGTAAGRQSSAAYPRRLRAGRHPGRINRRRLRSRVRATAGPRGLAGVYRVLDRLALLLRPITNARLMLLSILCEGLATDDR